MTKRPSIKISRTQLADDVKSGLSTDANIEMYFDCKIPEFRPTFHNCELIRTKDGEWWVQVTIYRKPPILTDDAVLVEPAIKAHVKLLRSIAAYYEEAASREVAA